MIRNPPLVKWGVFHYNSKVTDLPMKKTIKSLRKALKAAERSPIYSDEELAYLRQQLKVLIEGRDAMNHARRQVQGFSK